MEKLFLFIVTCGFVGYLPYIPGTFASAAACVILYFFPFKTLSTYTVFSILFVAFSILCINILNFKGKDPRYIVIDEFAGMFITMVGHRIEAVNLMAGFILFRFFDIVKPYPVRYVERYKKGYGIVADDVVAGIFANVCLYIFIFIKGQFK